ncbi:MAG: TIM barrel protein [Chloroflexi bacterium]|nr:TIM barrel protein [Anaerolineaceae bacterium]NMB87392.1 TIM barrel protein [Chloroflexota bacterium]
MEFTGYLDFWFTDRPLLERVEAFAGLGIHRLDVWLWRSVPMAELAAECKRCGSVINSTFDEGMGSLADPGDNELTLRTWAESLEMAEQHGVEHLFIFSNQVDVINGKEWTRRLSRNVTEAEQYANLLDQTEKIMRLVEQTKVEVWVEALNQFHIQGGVLVHDHDLAADWVRRIDHPQFRLAFDCYHQQRTAGNLFYGLEAYYGLYPTVHVGDVPTRQEPGTGEINFKNLVKKLRQLGFDGYIGLECRPSVSEEIAFQNVKDIFLA